MSVSHKLSRQAASIAPAMIALGCLLAPLMQGCGQAADPSSPRAVIVVISPTPHTTPDVPPLPSATLPGPTPGASLTPPVVTFTATPAPTPEITTSRVITHVVQEDEVLGGIALTYQVSLEALIAANGLTDPNMIRAGAVLTVPAASDPGIPLREVVAGDPTPTVTHTPTSAPVVTATEWVWQPSILTGNLSAAYPASRATDRFTIHYTPGTHPEATLEQVTAMLQTGLAHLERLYATPLAGHFDVYVAGSLFAAPSQTLRGRSFSAARQIFFLHDGTGNAHDQLYISTHEMTHLFTWNVFGRPVSAMLSEGAAVHAGMVLIEDARHIPLETFCAAYLKAGALPRITSHLTFEGHIRDLPNYYAAGCFVGYLMDTYGPESFGRLYPTGDYTAAYGKPAAVLESEWRQALGAAAPAGAVDPDKLVDAVNSVSRAYDQLLVRFTGTPSQYAAYLELDKARIALLEGRLVTVETHLTAMRTALNP